MGRKRPRVPLAGAAALMACVAGAACVGMGLPTQAASATGAPSPAVDRHGDPLPRRAVSRLGTLRFLHHDFVTAVAFSHDGRHFASAAADRSIIVWQWPDGRALHTLSFANLLVGRLLSGLHFAPDGRFLAATGNGRIIVWDLTTEKTILEARGLRDPAFAPDSNRIAWRESERVVRVHDLKLGKQIAEYRRPHRVLDAGYAAGGKLLLAEYRAGTIALYDPVRDQQTHAISMDGDRASWAQFASSCDRLAVQLKEGGIRLIDVQDGTECGRAAGLPAGVPVALSPDGRSLLWQANKQATLAIWDLNQDKHVCTINSYAGEAAQRSGAFSPDGKWVALGGTNHPHAASFWDTGTGRRAKVEAGHGAPLYALRFSPDGKEIATCTAMHSDPIVRMWDPESGKLLRSFAAHRYGVADVVYTPDGARLITCGLWGDEDICVWDARTLDKQLKLKAHRHGAGYVAVAPDGKRFVSVGAGKTPEDVAVWDLQTGTQLYTHATLGQSVQGIAFLSPRSLLLCNWQTLHRWDMGAPPALGEWSFGSGDGLAINVSCDGRLVAVGQRRSPAPVRLIETLSGQEVARFDAGAPCGAVALAPDGRTIALGTARGEIRLLDPASGRTILSFPAYPSAVHRLTFSPDGSRLASSGGGIELATALVWNVADATHRPPEQIEASEFELARWRKALVGTDGAAAYQAAARLRNAPRQAVTALQPVIATHAKSAASTIRAWIDDLDSDIFDVRDQAHDALVRAGTSAVEHMVKALGNNPSVEQRVRLKQILSAVGKQPVSAEQLSASRIVMVLEWIGTTEARALLQQLAKGDRDAAITEEAQAALARRAMAKLSRP